MFFQIVKVKPATTFHSSFSSPHARWISLASLVAAIFLVAGAGRVSGAQSVEVSWDHSNTPDISHYQVFYGSQSGVYTNSVIVVGYNAEQIIYNLQSGVTYYFAVQATDVDGHNSALSEEVSYSVPVLPPVILQTEVVLDGQQLELQITGSVVPAGGWSLESSTDLISWSPLPGGSGYGYGNVFVLVAMDKSTEFFRVQRF